MDTEIFRVYREQFGKCLDDDAPTPSFICERLFLGSVNDAKDKQKMAALGITHVVCLAQNLYPRELFDGSGITLLAFDARDIDR